MTIPPKNMASMTEVLLAAQQRERPQKTPKTPPIKRAPEGANDGAETIPDPQQDVIAYIRWLAKDL